MKTSALLILGLAFGQAVFAEELITKIVKVHGNPKAIADVACLGLPLRCDTNPTLKAIVVKGNAGTVENLERIIQELDGFDSSSSNAKNVETTVYVIAGSAELVPGTQDVSGEALMPVVKQLRPVFPYAHYQLLGTMMLRSAQSASAKASGLMKSVLALPDYSLASEYKIGYASAVVSPDAVATIKLKDFKFEVRVPVVSGSIKSDSKTILPTTQFQRGAVDVEADIDLREGQKVVVGKANVGDSDTCFFIVVSAKLVP